MPISIGTIAQHINVVHNLFCKTECLSIWNAKRCGWIHDENSTVIISETKFASRATHTFARNTNNGFGFDQTTVEHRRARRCPRDDVAGLHVKGPTPHVVFGAITIIKKDAMYFGGIGMSFSFNNTRGDHARHSCANFFNTFNSKTDI
ncbi:unannotated protein [freshwater metagenome]|uniref:Unannotated protein n=1 Tax=freshwater metagenome TaxID=449393 RepID=A0A6J6GCY2_9ZZZZ